MELKGKKIGIAFCGSFCTFDKVFHELEHLKETGAEIYPVFSDAAKGIESRFGKPADFIKKAEEIAGRKPILCIEEAEPIGPKGYLDLLAIIPCTGNTAAKLANGGIDGGKSASQKREASRYFYFHERWIGNEYEKYRHIIKYKKCVFCSFRAG